MQLLRFLLSFSFFGVAEVIRFVLFPSLLRFAQKKMYCRMCAASGSTLGKEKIKMKKEVVDIRSNNYLTICIILHKCFVIVV